MSRLLTSIFTTIVISILASINSWCYTLNDPSAPLVQVAPMATAPTIDGNIGRDEWKSAAASNNVHEIGSLKVIPSAPTIYFAYDSSNLYIAAIVPVSAGAKIKAQRLPHDGPVWEDDALELFLDPKHTNQDSYQFLVNSLGSMTELGNQDIKWNGEWQAVASQASNSWSVEIRIPWKSLGVDSVDAGTVIGINVGLDITSPTSHPVTWSPLSGSSFSQPGKYSHLVLSPAGPVVAAVSRLDDKSLEFDISTVNTNISSTLNVSKDGVLIGTQNLAGPGKLAYTIPLKDGKTEYGDYQWELVASDNGTSVFRQSGITKVTKIPPVTMTLRKYFLQGKLAADIDASGLKVTDQPLSFIGTIFDQSGKQVASNRIDVTSGRVASINYDLSKLEKTKYILKIDTLASNGSILDNCQTDFTLPPKPAWLGSKIGITDKVLAPWGPLKTKSTKGNIVISPDCRTYTFSGSPLPDSITAAGASLFTGPITMKLSVDGKKTTLKGRLKIIKNTPARVELQGTASVGSLKVDSKVIIDYDGNAFVNLKLHGSRGVTIDSFIIEAPIKKKHALYRYYYPGGFGTSVNARALESKGWGAAFVPYIWLGDNDRGFALYSTSDQNWNNKSDVKAVQAIPTSTNTVSLRFNIITDPLKLSAAQATAGLKYTLGFEATPNKKPDKDVWDYRINHTGYFIAPNELTSDNPALRMSNNTVLTYKNEKLIDLAHGTMDMWLRVRFDPDVQYKDESSMPGLNRDLLIISSGSQHFGLFWCIADRGMRFYGKSGTNLLFVRGMKTDWKQNELHHISITWGSKICLYIDGQLITEQENAGLMPKTPGDAVMELMATNPGFDIDELRVSNIERKPEVPNAPYVADANTLLLDHFDKKNKTATVPVVGTPGLLQGFPIYVDGKFDKALGCTEKALLTLDYLKQLGVKSIVLHENWTEIESYTETINNQEKLKNMVKACHERGIKFLLYFGYLLSDIAPEWDPYRLETLGMPMQGLIVRDNPQQNAYTVCYASAWQDFVAYGIDKAMTKYDLDGVYLDGVSSPWQCNNTEHGCGYEKTDGSIAGTYPILGARDVLRRIYAIVKSHKPDGQVNIHNSTSMVIPDLGWATSYWDGEQFGAIARGVDLDKLFPMDSFRTEFMGRQWGPPAELLCYEIPYTTHEAFSFSLLHDILVRGYGPGLYEESQLWKAMDKFGRKQAQFKPYWNNSNLVKVTGDKCYSTLYVRPGKGVMCLVSNQSKDARDVKVRLILKKMKLSSNVTATNAKTGDKINIKNGEFTVSLSPLDYALVWVK